MKGGCNWRIYLKNLSDPLWNESYVYVIKYWRGRCGVTFQVDSAGVSPITPFGDIVPSVTGLKPYVSLRDVDEARPWFDAIRPVFVRNMMGRMGFHGDGPTDRGERFLEASVTDDGTILVSVSSTTLHMDPIQTFWSISGDSMATRTRNLIEEDGRYRVLGKGTPIPEGDIAETLSRALTRYFDNRLETALAWEPGVSE